MRLSSPTPPEQNGVAERINRTILESARSMMHFASLPLSLWAEACNTAVYLLNRAATKSVDGKTPFEIWKGMKPNLSHIRVFGSTLYVHIPKEKPEIHKVLPCWILRDAEGFRAWDPKTGKVLISRDVVFQELENGVPCKPPNGVFDLISHLFEPDLCSSKTPVTLPVGVRVFDLLPSALGENEDEQNPATVQFDDQEPEGDPAGEPEMEDNPIDEPDVENDSVG